MTRRQLRRMVRFEAALVATFGATLGVGLGLLFGFGVVAALPASFASGCLGPGRPDRRSWCSSPPSPAWRPPGSRHAAPAVSTCSTRSPTEKLRRPGCASTPAAMSHVPVRHPNRFPSPKEITP